MLNSAHKQKSCTEISRKITFLSVFPVEDFIFLCLLLPLASEKTGLLANDSVSLASLFGLCYCLYSRLEESVLGFRRGVLLLAMDLATIQAPKV